MGFPRQKNTGVGCYFFLQGIFLTQGLNLCLLYCRRILYCWATSRPACSLHPKSAYSTIYCDFLVCPKLPWMSTFPCLQPAPPLHSDHAQEEPIQYPGQRSEAELLVLFFLQTQAPVWECDCPLHVPHQHCTPHPPIMPAGLLTQTLICLVSDCSLLPVCLPWFLLSSPCSALNCQPNHIFPSHKILQWFLLPVE